MTQVFSTEALPVGHSLFGGSVDVVPATMEDQVPGKPPCEYKVHYKDIKMKDGLTHLVVGVLTEPATLWRK